MLGRTAEARRELDAARRMNPACELLDAAEADLRCSPRRARRAAAATGVLPAIEWEKWGGLVRWKQIARVLAFVYTLAPLEGVSLGSRDAHSRPGRHAQPGDGRSGWRSAPATSGLRPPAHSGATAMTILRRSPASLALALVARAPAPRPERALKGPAPAGLDPRRARRAADAWRPRSAWRCVLLQGHRPHDHRAAPSSSSACIRFAPRHPPPSCWSAGRRCCCSAAGAGRGSSRSSRWALALFSLSEAHARPLQSRISTTSRSTALRSSGARRARRRCCARRASRGTGCSSARCSPRGAARSSRSSSTAAVAKKPRFGIRVRDFEGHVVELDGAAAAFVDDQRMLIVRQRRDETRDRALARSARSPRPTPSWSRRIPTLINASVEVEPTGEPIVLTGPDARAREKPFIVRTGFGRNAPLRVAPHQFTGSGRRSATSDSSSPQTAEAGSVVSRQREAHSAKASSGRLAVRPDRPARR